MGEFNENEFILHGCALRSKKLVKMVSFQFKITDLFPMNIGGIKGISYYYKIFFGMDQYVLELVEGFGNLLANLS